MANNITTITSVNLPAHLYPHIETRINDNSIRRYMRGTSANYKMLAVSLTPKGQDGKIITVDGGIDEYDDMFGAGPFDVYGQAHLNARAAASTGKVTLQVLRLTAPDATYANTHIFIHYKIVEDVVADDTTADPGITPGDGTETSDSGGTGGASTPTVTPAGEKKMKVMFTTESSVLTNLDDLASSAPDIATVQAKLGEEGWTTMRFMSFAYVGKGKCGNNYSIRIANNSRSDRTSGYKNYYFSPFSGTSMLNETRVTLYPEALVGGNSLYIENVINQEAYSAVDCIKVDVNENVLPAIFAAYATNVDTNTALTESEFDPILGINKRLASVTTSKYASVTPDIAINNFEIISDPNLNTVQFNTVLGIKLSGGSDGVFDTSTDPAKREAAINRRFVQAFNGEIDRNILSKYRCPIEYALDANFNGADIPVESEDDPGQNVKAALAQLTVKRNEDFRTYFDLNTDLTSLSDPVEDSRSYDYTINTWTMSIDGYWGKIKDPVSKKIVSVTSTYHLASALPEHWYLYGGKHIPYAGSSYAVVDTFIPNTAYPIYDNNIDQDILDKLVDVHVNYLSIDPRQNIIRGTQTTRYSGSDAENQFVGTDDYVVSNLSEENNALIVLDVKRDVERLITKYSYNFNETAEIATFNRETSALTNKYAAAQVRSITAEYARTEEEAELGVLHLYIAIENKPLIKYLQVDIDVNRLSTATNIG